VQLISAMFIKHNHTKLIVPRVQGGREQCVRGPVRGSCPNSRDKFYMYDNTPNRTYEDIRPAF